MTKSPMVSLPAATPLPAISISAIRPMAMITP